MTSRYDLIVFDWDGTLFDSTALIARCIQAAATDLGVQPPTDEQARYVIGLGLREALTHAVPRLPESRYKELGERYRHHYLGHQRDLVLFDGTLAMLEELKARGHKLAVATGKSRRGLDDVLAHTALEGMFDATRTADETAGKPHPLMLLQILDELRVPAARTLMIGDTTHDLEMAQRAGCDGLGVGFGAHDTVGFQAFSPVHVAHSTAELQAWLRTHG